MSKEYLDLDGGIPSVDWREIAKMKNLTSEERRDRLIRYGLADQPGLQKVVVGGDVQIMYVNNDFLPEILTPKASINDLNLIDIEGVNKLDKEERLERWRLIREGTSWVPKPGDIIKAEIDGNWEFVYINEYYEALIL